MNAMSKPRHHPLEVIYVATVYRTLTGDSSQDIYAVLDRLKDFPPSRFPGLWGPSGEEAPQGALELEHGVEQLRGFLRFFSAAAEPLAIEVN